MNLPWSEAVQLMREQYRAQTGLDPAHAPRRTPEQDLWSEFQRFRKQYSDAFRAEWLERGARQQARCSAIKATFYAKRSAVVDNTGMLQGPRAVVRCQWRAWSGLRPRPSCENRSLTSGMC